MTPEQIAEKRKQYERMVAITFGGINGYGEALDLLRVIEAKNIEIERLQAKAQRPKSDKMLRPQQDKMVRPRDDK